MASHGSAHHSARWGLALLGVLGSVGALAQPAPQALQAAAASSAGEKVKALKAAAAQGVELTPQSLGEFARDNVYTAVTPCRAVDTRVAGGALAANVTRTFDADGSNFAPQGGSSTGCGVPFNAASAVAMTFHTIAPAALGYLKAWGLGSAPGASVMNFSAGQALATTSIVPIVPGSGNDFSIVSSVGTQMVIDIIGYFAAPQATALDCTSVASAVTPVPDNQYTAVDAFCSAGYTVTGGGTYPTEGTLGRPAIWIDGSPIVNGWRTWVDNQTGSGRTVQTFAQCCRVPGR